MCWRAAQRRMNQLPRDMQMWSCTPYMLASLQDFKHLHSGLPTSGSVLPCTWTGYKYSRLLRLTC